MAATTESTQHAAMTAASSNYAAVTLKDNVVAGEVQYARFDVPTTTDNAALDVITLGVLPPGAVVLPELSRIIVTDDMSSGAVTIDIGDATNPDRYADGVDCAAVGIKEFLTPAIPDGFTTRYEIPAGTDQTIIATLATFAATIEAGSFSVILAFKTL